MHPSPWRIEISREFDFEKFLRRLPEKSAAYVVRFLETNLNEYGERLAGTDLVKPLGGGLFELRLKSNQHELGNRLLVRIFFQQQREKLILILGAYDKGRDPSKKRQRIEIAIARKRMVE